MLSSISFLQGISTVASYSELQKKKVLCWPPSIIWNNSAAWKMTPRERWQTITQKTQHLRDLNQHNGWLLEGQIERNQQAIQVLKPHQEPTLYGANGQTSAAHRGGKKFSI